MLIMEFSATFHYTCLSLGILFIVGTLTFCDHREQNFSALMVERGVLGFPKHNLAPSSKNKRRDICFGRALLQARSSR